VSAPDLARSQWFAHTKCALTYEVRLQGAAPHLFSRCEKRSESNYIMYDVLRVVGECI